MLHCLPGRALEEHPLCRALFLPALKICTTVSIVHVGICVCLLPPAQEPPARIHPSSATHSKSPHPSSVIHCDYTQPASGLAWLAETSHIAPSTFHSSRSETAFAFCSCCPSSCPHRWPPRLPLCCCYRRRRRQNLPLLSMRWRPHCVRYCLA